MPRRRRQRWFALEVDGEPFHVKGDPDMDPKTREALIALARALRAMVDQGTLPVQKEEPMQIKTITVRYGRTQSLEQYSNVRPEITIGAELDAGEDPEGVKAQLLAEARAFVEEAVDEALEVDGRGAKFSREPRYRLALTAEEIYRGGWNNRNKITAPDKLLVLLPQRVNPNANDFPGHVWWSEPYGPSSKLRLAHAQRAAAQWLAEHQGYRLIDCSDGDLSKIPEWALVAPPDPDPAPALVARDPDDLGDDLDRDDGEDNSQ
jgi:hypothetical protein